MTDGDDDVDWSDVERLISDLKNDGYEPAPLKGVPSDATRQKQIYISLSRELNNGR